MRELEHMTDKVFMSLADAFLLEPREDPDEDELTVSFYIDGLRDYVMQAEDYGDRDLEVSTYSFIRSLSTYTEGCQRDLSTDEFYEDENQERLVKILIGCHERVRKLIHRGKNATSRISRQ